MRVGRRVWGGFELLLFLAWQILLSSVFVAWEVLEPRLDLRPGIVAVPLDIHSETGLTILSSLVTLTPGTLGIDISSDRKVMYVHALDFKDPEQFRQRMKQNYERRVIEVFG